MDWLLSLMTLVFMLISLLLLLPWSSFGLGAGGLAGVSDPTMSTLFSPLLFTWVSGGFIASGEDCKVAVRTCSGCLPSISRGLVGAGRAPLAFCLPFNPLVSSPSEAKIFCLDLVLCVGRPRLPVLTPSVFFLRSASTELADGLV